jgi:hypothetical protein
MRKTYFVFPELTMGHENDVVLFGLNLSILIEIIKTHFNRIRRV